MHARRRTCQGHVYRGCGVGHAWQGVCMKDKGPLKRAVRILLERILFTACFDVCCITQFILLISQLKSFLHFATNLPENTDVCIGEKFLALGRHMANVSSALSLMAL